MGEFDLGMAIKSSGGAIGGKTARAIGGKSVTEKMTNAHWEKSRNPLTEPDMQEGPLETILG